MIGIAGISAAISVVAIILALRANRHAKESETRSREMIASERRRAFDLEIIRDLVDALDDPQRFDSVMNNPAYMSVYFKTRLEMLPEDLPAWHAALNLRSLDLYERYEDLLPAGEFEQYYTNRDPKHGVVLTSAVQVAFAAELKKDLQAAVERRMTQGGA